MSVQMIKKHKMARLLPNGLAITTNTSQKVSKFLGQGSLVCLPIPAPGAQSLALALSQVFLYLAPFCFLYSSMSLCPCSPGTVYTTC